MHHLSKHEPEAFAEIQRLQTRVAELEASGKDLERYHPQLPENVEPLETESGWTVTVFGIHAVFVAAGHTHAEIRRELAYEIYSRLPARVAELEEKMNLWPVDTKGNRIFQAGADAAQKQWDRARKDLSRIEPRPMSEAPRDGTEFLQLIPRKYRFSDNFCGFIDVVDSEYGGWLPLPDQSERGE